MAYFATMQALAHRPLPVFATASDLPPTCFDGDFTEPTRTLRLIRSEPQPEVDGESFGFAPTPHRVINQASEARCAIPSFYGPDNEAVIRMVPSCTGPEDPPRYEPLRYLDHRMKLNRVNFDHRRKDAPSPAACVVPACGDRAFSPAACVVPARGDRAFSPAARRNPPLPSPR